MAIHIIPENDLRPHVMESTCECQPSVIDENGEMIFVHHSFDGRELAETLIKELNQ